MDTSASDTSKDVGSSSLHQGHESLVLEDLSEAIQRSIVLDSTTRGHHHPPSDSVNGVGHESRSDSHSPSKDERKSNSSILSKDEWLECVIEAKVHATVDEDTNGRDDETSVKSLDTIGLEGLDIDINKTIELSFTSFALGIISKPGSGVVQRVDKQQGKSSCKSSTGNVGSKLQSLRSILRGLEQALDLILEGKVQSLSWEVSQHIGKISSPERVNSLSLQDPHCTVDNTSVWLVKTSLLDHLILVLDEKLNSLDGSSSSFETPAAT